MNRKFYIYVIEKFDSGRTFGSILPFAIKVPFDERLPEEETLLKELKEKHEKQIRKMAKENNEKFGFKTEIEDIEIVARDESEWVQGEYFAHEYGEYVQGRARRLTYSNGFVEYQVECLESKYSVLDGIWEDLYGNGCGDRFEPFARFKEDK